MTAADLVVAAATDELVVTPGMAAELLGRGVGIKTTPEEVEMEEAEGTKDVRNVDPLSLGNRSDEELHSEVALPLVHVHDNSDSVFAEAVLKRSELDVGTSEPLVCVADIFNGAACGTIDEIDTALDSDHALEVWDVVAFDCSVLNNSGLAVDVTDAVVCVVEIFNGMTIGSADEIDTELGSDHVLEVIEVALGGSVLIRSGLVDAVDTLDCVVVRFSGTTTGKGDEIDTTLDSDHALEVCEASPETTDAALAEIEEFVNGVPLRELIVGPPRITTTDAEDDADVADPLDREFVVVRFTGSKVSEVVVDCDKDGNIVFEVVEFVLEEINATVTDTFAREVAVVTFQGIEVCENTSD